MNFSPNKTPVEITVELTEKDFLMSWQINL